LSTRDQAPAASIDSATLLADHLHAINRVLRRSIEAEAQRLPVPLTRPQVLALQVLVEADPQSGLSLSELSEQMGLAHSTVSGIVTRLQERGLVQRATRADDRRHIRIQLTDPVRGWVDHELPTLRRRPLETALKRLGDERTTVIVDALAELRRLLET
jgi:DNA-binding MarR family transcriptional regulator